MGTGESRRKDATRQGKLSGCGRSPNYVSADIRARARPGTPSSIGIRIVAGQSIISGRVLLQCRSAARFGARRMRRAAVRGHSPAVSGPVSRSIRSARSRAVLGPGVAVAIARDDHLRGAFHGDGMARAGLAPSPGHGGCEVSRGGAGCLAPTESPQVRGRGVGPTEYPRTRRHNAAFSGTAASMAVLALTGLYAGRAG